MNLYKTIKKISFVFLLLTAAFIFVACTPDEEDPTVVINYTVTFNTNGGSAVSPIEVEQGSTLTLPASPTKAGYTFDGWYINTDLSTAFSNLLLTGDITVYAKWTINSYTVTFNSNGGTAVDNASVEYGLTVALPTDPEKTDFVFAGWYSDSALLTSYNFSTLVTQNITLYAKWDVYVPSNLELLTEDLEALTLPEEVEANMTLPTSGLNGTVYSWSSDKPHLISNSGKVLLAGYGTGGETVILTVTATKGTESATQDFEVLVPEKAEALVTSSKVVDFDNLANEYIVPEGQIELFFANGDELPYVDIESFLYLLDGALDSIAGASMEVTGDDGLLYDVVRYIEVIVTAADQITVRYVAEYSQLGVLVETETYEALVDFTLNTFSTETFDFLDALGAATETDFGAGLSFGDTEIFEGNGVNINLGNYRFDLIVHVDGEDTYYLMPLPVANLIFVGQVYYDVYYNGDQLYGVDSYQLLDGDEATMTSIRTTSYNSKTITLNLRAATYDFLALAFDHFYGLREVNGVDTYYDVFGQYVDQIIYGRDSAHYEAIFDLTYGLDDLHTYHITTGYYVEPDFGFQLEFITQLGERSAGYTQSSWGIDAAIALVFPSGRPAYRVLSDGLTAVITIDSFTVDTPNDFYRSLTAIQTEYPGVINVIVDLTNNGGGNVGAVWRTLGYMTDDVIYYHTQNPADGSAATYTIYDEYPMFDYNWFILISPVTFSAANHMASTAKEQGIATVIGIQSSGGASSISGIVLPTGDVIFMSSSNVISRRLDGDIFESVEYGVTVEYEFTLFGNLYDDAFIVNAIAELNSQVVVE